MSKTSEAISLLQRILSEGYKMDYVICDSIWALPIELKWDIERFVRKIGRSKQKTNAEVASA